ncbi:MAG: EI24 domain-containing protein [Pseudomonadota bacterium]
MIFTCFLRALAQLPDGAFRRVLLIGIGATIALLVGATWAFSLLLGWLVPETVTLPWIGDIGWADDVASGLGIATMMILSVFLMVPVASAFTSLFLEDIADAVEARYYPHLPAAPRTPFVDGLRDTVSFLGVIIVANLAALILYVIFAPFAPFIFWALNGFLLGREYFQVTAMRRLGREGAARMRKKHMVTIWAAGILMAVPLTIPVINLLVPVLGAATFTHLYHAVSSEQVA